jgi:DNA-binding transcriptional LysR family regulator
MELRQLEHFVAVAEERSFTRAARRMNIVQSGLSMSIRSLEEELGTKLFERSARGVVLTPAGEAMLPEARRAISAVDSARVAVDATQGLLRGTLAVGVAQASDPGRVARLIGRFHDEYPGVTVRVIQGSAETLMAGVSAGEIDIALCGKPQAMKKPLNCITLVRAPFVLACGPKHPLATRDRVTLKELTRERFIDMNTGWTSRQLTDRAFGQAGMKRDIVCELDDVVLLLQMVEEGLGVAIIPGISTRITSGLKYVAIHPPLPEWQFVVAFHGDQPANTAARVFLGMATREWQSR